MGKGRHLLYKDLKNRINPTPLVELSIDVPHGNRIISKLEYDPECHPTRSHYDRVFASLIEYYELGFGRTPRGKPIGPISPEKTHLLGVSTGNAGAALSYTGSELGYPVTIIVPEGLPESRLDFIRRYGATIDVAPREKYMKGSIDRLIELITKVKYDDDGKRYITPNHAFTKTTTECMAGFIDEAWEQNNGNINCGVFTIGNGASLFGSARALRLYNPVAKIVGWEPFASGIAHNKHYPGEYEKEFRIVPGQLKHELLGAMGPGTPTPFIDTAYEESIIDETLLVVDNKQLEGYTKLVSHDQELLEKVKKLIWWEEPTSLLKEAGYDVGRTSIAGVAVALKLAEDVKGKTFFTVFYDHAEKYK